MRGRRRRPREPGVVLGIAGQVAQVAASRTGAQRPAPDGGVGDVDDPSQPLRRGDDVAQGWRTEIDPRRVGGRRTSLVAAQVASGVVIESRAAIGAAYARAGDGNAPGRARSPVPGSADRCQGNPEYSEPLAVVGEALEHRGRRGGRDQALAPGRAEHGAVRATDHGSPWRSALRSTSPSRNEIVFQGARAPGRSPRACRRKPWDPDFEKPIGDSRESWGGGAWACHQIEGKRPIQEALRRSLTAIPKLLFYRPAAPAGDKRTACFRIVRSSPVHLCRLRVVATNLFPAPRLRASLPGRLHRPASSVTSSSPPPQPMLVRGVRRAFRRRI